MSTLFSEAVVQTHEFGVTKEFGELLRTDEQKPLGHTQIFR